MYSLPYPVCQLTTSYLKSLAPYPIEQPIFILAPPRSGSTFLFECLAQFEELYHLPHEADGIWWKLFPYERSAERSDFVGAEELSPKLKQLLRQHFYRSAVAAYYSEGAISRPLTFFLGLKPIRYLDKTIANCFHLDALEQVFPDAYYVFLVRDPRANISSMIDGWPHLYRYGKPQLLPVFQDLPDATIDHWTYPAPPGWQKMVHLPLPEICAWSWQQHIESVLDFFQDHPKQPLLVRYEDLRANPPGVIQDLAHQLKLKWTSHLSAYLENPPHSRTTLSSAQVEKWKQHNLEAVHSILPKIRATASTIGYEL